MLRYGGHTSCVEVRCGDLIFALDAGTGILPMTEQEDIQRLHILLSHTHMDHIMGLCCMRKLFDPQFEVNFWAGHLIPERLLHEALEQLLSPPLFPIALKTFPSVMMFHDFRAGHALHHGDFAKRGISIITLPLNHPDRATAYRINYQGKSVCYVTDVEHVRDTLDQALISFISGCDVFIYDSTYDERDFALHEGWGHSTWQHAVKLGEQAKVGNVVLFHHDPYSTDDLLDARAREIKETYRQSVIIAREGLVCDLNSYRAGAAGSSR